jgi:hypothetical protein
LSVASQPSGLSVAAGATADVTPFTRTVIEGGKITVSAPSPQTLNRTTYYWKSWSDGGAQVHDIVAPATATTYTATYRQK